MRPCMDRLSDHRFMANYFRLYLHAAAFNLLARLRREIADPPPHDPTRMSPWKHCRSQLGSNTRTSVVARTRWAKVNRLLGDYS